MNFQSKMKLPLDIQSEGISGDENSMNPRCAKSNTPAKILSGIEEEVCSYEDRKFNQIKLWSR